MNQGERRIFLIKELLKEDKRYKNIEIPKNPTEQVDLLRALMNVRMPKEISEEFLKVQDEYLKEEINKKGIVDINDLEPIKEVIDISNLESIKGSADINKLESIKEISDINNVNPMQKEIYLWQGDITTLRCDAIVNAANSAMTGCYVPNHRCIDNAIHSFAGVELRLECDEIMNRQEHGEPTGQAKITNAYNLPCKYIIHTVGPIISYKLTSEDCELLASCYRSCLNLAAKNNLESIAFCCISTGEFHFPNDKAAQIAIKTVEEFMKKDTSIKKVIFNVFKDMDKEIYRELLK